VAVTQTRAKQDRNIDASVAPVYLGDKKLGRVEWKKSRRLERFVEAAMEDAV
jgi:hypothetical protein